MYAQVTAKAKKAIQRADIPDRWIPKLFDMRKNWKRAYLGNFPIFGMSFWFTPDIVSDTLIRYRLGFLGILN